MGLIGISIAVMLLSLAGGMFLLAKTQKDNLGAFYKVTSWFIIVFSFLMILFSIIHCIAGGMYRREMMMHNNEMMQRNDWRGEDHERMRGHHHRGEMFMHKMMRNDNDMDEHHDGKEIIKDTLIIKK